MEHDFLVNVVVGEPQKAADQRPCIPLLIRAESAAAALSSFAEISCARIIGPLHESDSMASGVVGVEDRTFDIIVCDRQDIQGQLLVRSRARLSH